MQTLQQIDCYKGKVDEIFIHLFILFLGIYFLVRQKTRNLLLKLLMKVKLDSSSSWCHSKSDRTGTLKQMQVKDINNLQQRIILLWYLCPLLRLVKCIGNQYNQLMVFLCIQNPLLVLQIDKQQR